MKKSFLITAGKYGAGLSLLTWVIWGNWRPANGGGIADALEKPLQIVPLTLAATIVLTCTLLTFIRWYVLVRAQDLPFTVGNALRLGLIGYFLSTFLPGNIGGDIVKAAFIAREQSRRTVAVATVIIDRVIGLWALFWLVSLIGGGFWLAGDPAILAIRGLRVVITCAACALSISIVTWLLLGFLPARRAEIFADRLNRRIGHAAAEFWRAVWIYRCQSKSVALALFMAMVSHIGFVSSFYFAARTFLPDIALDQIPSLAEHFVIVPVGMILQAVIPVPGGLGVGEWGYGALYQMLGKVPADGVMSSLTLRMIGWGFALLGYLVFLRMKPALQGLKEIDSTDDGEQPRAEVAEVKSASLPALKAM